MILRKFWYKAINYSCRAVSPVDIDSEIVGDFFASCNISPNCTFCSNQNLAVNEVTTTSGFRIGSALGTYTNGYTTSSIYSPDVDLNFYALTCQRCGHIMIFDIDIILQWYESELSVKMKGDIDG